jgi:hypothetical protein
MGTRLYVPGPALIALGASGGSLAFLGYSVNGVQFAEQMLEQPVMADYAGPRMPADMMAAGKVITCQMMLTDYDPLVLNNCLARYNGGTAGALGVNELGTLLNAEGAMYRLCVKAKRQTAVAAYANYYPGINVPKGYFQGGFQYPIATSPQVVPLAFFGFPVVNKADLSAVLWNVDMTGFPALT